MWHDSISFPKYSVGFSVIQPLTLLCFSKSNMYGNLVNGMFIAVSLKISQVFFECHVSKSFCLKPCQIHLLYLDVNIWMLHYCFYRSDAEKVIIKLCCENNSDMFRINICNRFSFFRSTKKDTPFLLRSRRLIVNRLRFIAKIYGDEYNILWIYVKLLVINDVHMWL